MHYLACGLFPISTRQLISLFALLALSSFAAFAAAGPIRSAGAMTFVDANTLVVAQLAISIV